ncbi:uncharacterized protein B0I36DRAFT_92903 [Microdochium trichocladiopsis]|uniref:Uncharacterized protein n=1 Tax=Microdochium trichocladiopsis TaxID=1682393 RepID=A0A9P9BR12_9PEZI|nr:uncharacterized protein B0I36DRAFT_92903 [Microdochium trichocladiopsis]KAH7035458.1 hypothetical protein B0I36DRAFT_92903 [Microdochium trichocladiopsis]
MISLSETASRAGCLARQTTASRWRLDMVPFGHHLRTAHGALATLPAACLGCLAHTALHRFWPHEIEGCWRGKDWGRGMGRRRQDMARQRGSTQRQRGAGGQTSILNPPGRQQELARHQRLFLDYFPGLTWCSSDELVTAASEQDVCYNRRPS